MSRITSGWIAVAMLVVLGAVPVAHAQINKCVDRAGKVVAYGNDCPPGTRSETTGIRNAPAATPAPSKEKSLAEREADFRKRQIERQEAQGKEEKKLADEQSRHQSCDNARSYVKSLESGVRLVRTDPNTGERIFLDDADRAREMTAAQKAVEANCK
ncbi:MAG TPA: DUF4124 domain-containing protein [Burkholderiales bacterium]|nr:DUF4124 domain-containing protein [Burkholderiales bacterium]